MIPTDVEAIEVYLSGPSIQAFEQFANQAGLDLVKFPAQLQKPKVEGDEPDTYFLTPNLETMRGRRP